MTEWSKVTPVSEGWFWIKYRGKHGTTLYPCEVFHFGEATVVRTTRNDTFHEGPQHGGAGLKYDGKVDKSIRFGPRIEEPE